MDDLAALLGELPRLPQRELHCHPAVLRYLELTAPPREPDPPWTGSIGHLTGIPVIEKPDMERGAWELREDGKVVKSGTIPWWLAVLSEPIEVEFKYPDAPFGRQYLSGYVSETAPPAYRAYLGMPAL